MIRRQSRHDPAPAESVRPAHLLSFDVEEYFQVEAAASCGVGQDQWDSFPKRLAPSVDRILEILSAHKVSATFFVLGWVAEHEAKVVQRISAAGHEIASHGMTHQMVHRLTPEGFRRELTDSRALLEDISGMAVVGYRAPTFSIVEETAWAIDVLAETGYRYDSSVFPVHHDRYGVPDAPAGVHRAIGPAGNSIVEIPPLTLRLLGKNWPIGGGGYLRLLPVGLLAHALRKSERRGESGMIYLHPWEFDPGQPVLPMGRLSLWRHRVHLDRTEAKLERLLRTFRFGSIAETSSLDKVDRTHSYGPTSQ